MAVSLFLYQNTRFFVQYTESDLCFVSNIDEVSKVEKLLADCTKLSRVQMFHRDPLEGLYMIRNYHI